MGATNTFVVSAGDDLMTTPEVCELLKLSPAAVRQLPIDRMNFGHRSMRWRKSDINNWMASKLEQAS